MRSNNQPSMRGRLKSLSTFSLEKLVLSKPYFDRQGLIVADVEGRLAGGLSGGAISEAVLRQIGSDDSTAIPGPLAVLLNLDDCTGADSLGIGELISLHVSLANRGGIDQATVESHGTAPLTGGFFHFHQDAPGAIDLGFRRRKHLVGQFDL